MTIGIDQLGKVLAGISASSTGTWLGHLIVYTSTASRLRKWAVGCADNMLGPKGEA